VGAEVRRKVAQIDKDLSRYMSYRALKWVLKISIGIASVILYVLTESQPRSSSRGPDSHHSFGGGDLTSDGWSGEHYYTFERPDGSITWAA